MKGFLIKLATKLLPLLLLVSVASFASMPPQTVNANGAPAVYPIFNGHCDKCQQVINSYNSDVYKLNSMYQGLSKSMQAQKAVYMEMMMTDAALAKMKKAPVTPQGQATMRKLVARKRALANQLTKQLPSMQMRLKQAIAKLRATLYVKQQHLKACFAQYCQRQVWSLKARNYGGQMGVGAAFAYGVSTGRTGRIDNGGTTLQNKTVVNGPGFGFMMQYFLANHPLWLLTGGVSYPGDHHKTLLSGTAGNGNAISLSITKRYMLTLGLARNIFNIRSAMFLLGGGLGVLDQNSSITVQEAAPLTLSHNYIMATPYGFLETLVPVWRHLMFTAIASVNYVPRMNRAFVSSATSAVYTTHVGAAAEFNFMFGLQYFFGLDSHQ